MFSCDSHISSNYCINDYMNFRLFGSCGHRRTTGILLEHPCLYGGWSECAIWRPLHLLDTVTPRAHDQHPGWRDNTCKIMHFGMRKLIKFDYISPNYTAQFDNEIISWSRLSLLEYSLEEGVHFQLDCKGFNCTREISLILKMIKLDGEHWSNHSEGELPWRKLS